MFMESLLLIASLSFSINAFGGHHSEGKESYQEGQQAVLDAFGWDFEKAEITIEKINEDNHVLYSAWEEIYWLTPERMAS